MTANISPSSLGSLSALIVEDNEHMRILLRTLLNAFGVRQIWESNEGGDALKKVAAHKPDFVLTDFSMAPMDGIDFVKTVRHLPDKADCVLPIIMVTGHTERRRVEAARDVGVSEILAKPVTAQALFNHIEQIVLRPRPFLRSSNYCGPCRRRLSKPDYAGPWRRQADRQDERKIVNVDTQAAAAH